MLFSVVRFGIKENTLLSILVAGTRSAVFFAYLPYFSSRMSDSEFSLWLKIGVITQFVDIIHMGLLSTFARYYSYNETKLLEVIPGLKEERLESIARALFKTHVLVYSGIALLAFCGSMVYSFALIGEMIRGGHLNGILLFTFLNVSIVVQFFGRGLSSLVFGKNKIYLVRWGELGSIIILIVCIQTMIYFDEFSFGTLVSVISIQFVLTGLWSVAMTLKVNGNSEANVGDHSFSKSILRNLLRNSIRTGIGNGLIVGALSIALLLFDRYAEASSTTWMLYRITNSLSVIAQLVFIVSIPILTKHFAENKIREFRHTIEIRCILNLLLFIVSGTGAYLWLQWSSLSLPVESIRIYSLFLLAWYLFGVGKFISTITNIDNTIRIHYFGSAFLLLTLLMQVMYFIDLAALVLPASVLISSLIALYILGRISILKNYFRGVIISDWMVGLCVTSFIYLTLI